MSISAQLEFVHQGEVVSTFPQSVSSYTQTVDSHATDTPFSYVQGFFDMAARYGEHGFIVWHLVPFDSIQVRWPLDGSLYTWEAVLIRSAFKAPEFILRHLVD